MDSEALALVRAESAQRILNDPVFDLAFEQIRTAYLKQWEEMPTADTEDAKDIHRRIKCLGDVKQALEAHVSNGKLIEKKHSMLDRVTNAARNATKPLSNLNRSR